VADEGSLGNVLAALFGGGPWGVSAPKPPLASLPGAAPMAVPFASLPDYGKVPSPDFTAPPPGLRPRASDEFVPNLGAAKGLATGLVEPFGQLGRVMTGQSQDVPGDLAASLAAVTPMGKVGKLAKPAAEAAEAAATGGLGDFIKAYHGSPHDFDRFDLSKIGTGEGAQAYGHGLYFAENEGVAKQYRDTLAATRVPDAAYLDPDLGPKITASEQRMKGINNQIMEARFAGNSEQSINKLRSELNKATNDHLDLIEKTKFPGRMYQVAIKANPEHFLDWDKALSEQSPKVREAIEKLGPITPRFAGAGEPTGANAYAWLTQRKEGQTPPWDTETTTRKLREAGIPGIKYLDQGSRMSDDASKIVQNYGSREKALEVANKRLEAANNAFGQSAASDRKYWGNVVSELKKSDTRNYVVFDDKLIDILKKYGIAGIGALPAMNAYHYQGKGS
jgi:hypothetical protein